MQFLTSYFASTHHMHCHDRRFSVDMHESGGPGKDDPKPLPCHTHMHMHISGGKGAPHPFKARCSPLLAVPHTYRPNYKYYCKHYNNNHHQSPCCSKNESYVFILARSPQIKKVDGLYGYKYPIPQNMRAVWRGRKKKDHHTYT